MHMLGKVLAILVVLASFGAAILTAKLIQVRNSWTAKSMASKNKYAEMLPKIEKLETQIDSLRNELFRSRELWGGFWPSVQTQITNPDGSLSIGIGTDQGVRDKQLLHGFELSPAGDSAIYRGSFLVVGVQNATANLKPNWRATPDEVGKWQSTNWRWRNAIPSGYQETAERQLLTALKFEETLKARSRTVAGQNELLSKANESLKHRDAELTGGDLLGKSPKVETEFREGLVAAAEKTEEDRNKILIKIDELRRKVRKTQADIESLQSENVELTNRLPVPVNQLPEPALREEVTQKARRDQVTQKAE